MVSKISVTRLPKDPGVSGWNAILPPREEARKMQGDIRADWLIIGAGFAGLASARELSLIRPEDKIVVLDAVRTGEGPAGRNSGFMIDLPHDIKSDSYAGSMQDDIRETALNRHAIAFAKQAVEAYGLDRETFDPCGKLNAAASESGLRHNADYARQLAAMGEAYRLLDATEMRDLTGIDYYKGGLYTPGAAMIHPVKYIRGMADGLAGQVDLFENSPVVNLQSHNGDWTARTPGGSVTARKVVLAVNGHVESFGYFKRRLMHVFTYASMTRALSAAEVKSLGGGPRWAATPADPMGTTVRRLSGTGGDRVVIRNRFTYDPGMEVSPARIAAVKRSHMQSFRARFTSLSGVNMEYSWGGRLCLAWNTVPAFGEIEQGLFAACCQNGVGVAKGTLSGIMAARLASGADDDRICDLLERDRPRLLPPEPLAWLGVNATLRWKEWQAGPEL